METRFTFDEIMIIFKKLYDQYGPEKIEQLLHDKQISLGKPKTKTSDDLLEEINNY